MNNALEQITEGLYKINHRFAEDNRGNFTKIFQFSNLPIEDSSVSFVESYITESHANVIRGMHFQTPPFDHWKLVTVLNGTIVDVVLDLRKGDGFGKYYSFQLDENSKFSLLIAPGFAHGFKSMEDHTKLIYHVSSEYSAQHDFGIRYNSFGFDWNCENPIMSERDNNFIPFSQYLSPF